MSTSFNPLPSFLPHMSLINGPPSLGEEARGARSEAWQREAAVVHPQGDPAAFSVPPSPFRLLQPLPSFPRCRIRRFAIRRSSVSITRPAAVIPAREGAVPIAGAPSENPFPSPFPKRAVSPPRSGPGACRLHATVTVNFSRSLNTR